MNVSVIKYNAGNIRSVAFALERLGVNFSITDDAETIRKADKVIFPGVGEASSTMKHLKNAGLDTVIKSLRQPVLGICLGMQLMCRHSEENDTPCLGIFDLEVRRFLPDQEHKVPHMGWNSLESVRDWIPSSLSEQYTYFVHSYYVPVAPETCATTTHTLPFSSAIHKDNFYAVQFHPEKSAKVGATILTSFLDI